MLLSIVCHISDTRTGLCYTTLRAQQCLNPSPQLVTKSQCCCTLATEEAVGIGWGQPCEPCPAMHSQEYEVLCPHGPGRGPNGQGRSEELYLRAFNASPLDKMAAISQTIFSDAFSWMSSKNEKLVF